MSAAAVLLASSAAAVASPTAIASSKPILAASNAMATFTFGRQGSLLTHSLNPYNPNWVSFLSNVSFMQLAFAHPFSLTEYYPELARNVAMNGASVIVTLQNKEEWSDGKPLTSQDVMDAFLIDGVEGGNPIWSHLSSVVAPNAHQIVFTMKPGFPTKQLLPDIDSIQPVPAAIYGSLLPANLQTELLSDYALTAKSPSTAASSPVGKALAALDKKIIAFTPPTFLSDGPYSLVSLNTSEILLRKWDGFWDASQFKIPQLRFIVLGSNNAVYPAMLDGEFDETLVGMPKLIVEQTETHKDLTVFQNGDGTTVKGLFFNTRTYPFSIPGVRQAIAEMINREELVDDVWGVFSHGGGGAQPLAYPSPISPTIQAHYLTKAQVASLNPYNYNPGAADKALDGLGFKKTSSGWLMPNGKPFDVSLMAPSGWSGPDLASVYLGTLLNGLGIHTSVTEPEYEEFYSDLTGGNFDMIYFWTSCCEITNPLEELTLPLDDYNYSSPSQPGLGIGPVATVPGIGRVNIPETISSEANNMPIGTPQFDQTVYDWVRWFNATLPVYDIGYQTAFSVYDNSRFTDWPPLNSPIYRTYTNGSQGVMILAMQLGYIVPR